jgi:transposase
MIVPSLGVKVLIAMKPTDFRKGMDGLAALVRETLGANPYGGVIYVFRSKRSDRVKLLFWDGTGLVLAIKRLEQGSFRWPSLRDGVMRLTPAQLSALLEGLDWIRCEGFERRRRRRSRDVEIMWKNLYFAGDSGD